MFESAMTFFSKLSKHLGFGGASYKGKPGMRAYAVGDVHGCIGHLEALLGLIDADLSGFAGTSCVVFLGDLIDRGPDSRAVIEKLLTYNRDRVRPIFLMGNHEEFMLRSVAGELGAIHRWLEFGGAECVASYGLTADRLLSVEEGAAAALLREAIPARHLDFISGFGDTFAFGEYLFVHAGIRPGLALDRQEHGDLRWIREPFLSHRGSHGFMVVHGHTITEDVEERSNRIGIDTGAYRGGPLTALVVENEERRYLSTSGQAGRPLA